MAEPILGITAKLTSVAESILDIEPDKMTAEEVTMLRDRLPQWALTVAAIGSSVRALEEALLPRREPR